MKQQVAYKTMNIKTEDDFHQDGGLQGILYFYSVMQSTNYLRTKILIWM